MLWTELEQKLKTLEMALNINDVGVTRLMMEKLVNGFKPSDEIVDWIYLEQEVEAQEFINRSNQSQVNPF
jgi:hypothetical protein